MFIKKEYICLIETCLLINFTESVMTKFVQFCLYSFASIKNNNNKTFSILCYLTSLYLAQDANYAMVPHLYNIPNRVR